MATQAMRSATEYDAFISRIFYILFIHVMLFASTRIIMFGNGHPSDTYFRIHQTESSKSHVSKQNVICLSNCKYICLEYISTRGLFGMCGSCVAAVLCAFACVCVFVLYIPLNYMHTFSLYLFTFLLFRFGKKNYFLYLTKNRI